MIVLKFINWPSCCLLLVAALKEATGADDDYNVVHRDGSFEFGYNTPDSYHYADANRNNVVRGEFGGRNPETGGIDSTVYTAGPRGFRPRGKNVVRKYDLNQNGPRPIGSRDDPYYDPYEDPSYNFQFRTRTYNRQESANRVGDVNGRYSYVDDVGERHNVEYIAGKNTGFHVRTPFPDSNPRAIGPLFFNGRGRPIPRGRTSIQRGLDGSYRFVSAGPDQRRTETSDSTGHVRGSYTYLDDKGVQHSVHYIAGPETGYRVLKNVKGPHLPTVFPFNRPTIVPPDFYDYGDGNGGDVFDTAASGHIKPVDNNLGTGTTAKPDTVGGPFDNAVDVNKDDFDKFTNDIGGKPGGRPGGRPGRPFGGGRPSPPPFGGARPERPSYIDDGSDDIGDLFGDFSPSSTVRPIPPVTGGGGGGDDGSYKPTPGGSGDDGSYKPSGEDGGYRPGTSTTTLRPPLSGDSGESGFGTGQENEGGFGLRPGGGSRPSGGGGRPTGGGGARPSGGGRPIRPGGSVPSRPSYDYDGGDSGDDFGLFGSESGNVRPPIGGGRPVITVGGSGGYGGGRPGGGGCPACRGAIVTNLGDKLFTVPPGVSVRAHVQAIDLVPFESNVPSPSEQFKAETDIRTEQLNEGKKDIVTSNKSTTKRSTIVEKEESGSTTEASTDSTSDDIFGSGELSASTTAATTTVTTALPGTTITTTTTKTTSL